MPSPSVGVRCVLAVLLGSVCGGVVVSNTQASDWPQFMRDASHAADAGELNLPTDWHWAGAVPLEDAVLSSPVVWRGRVYVVDQMGTAYAIDPTTREILWKTKPPGVDAVGANTCSPCIVNGKLAYGTNAGSILWLDLADGRVLHRVELEQPIFGSLSTARNRVYLQSHDGIIHAYDDQGSAVWAFDPYLHASTAPGSRSKRQYSGVEVAVRGDRIVAAAGFDVVCLRETEAGIEHLWTLPKAISETYLPAGLSLDDDWVYASFPGKDGLGAMLRIDLATGQLDKETGRLDEQWAVLTPPAHRDGVVFACRDAFGLSAMRFGEPPEVIWSVFDESPRSALPAHAAPAVAGSFAFFVLREGGLAISSLAGDSTSDSTGPRPTLRIPTPNRAVSTSAPAVTEAGVYFGDDHGWLHIIRPGSASDSAATLADRTPSRRLVATRSLAVVPAGDRTDTWPSAFGNGANDNFIADPSIRPPLRRQWSTKCAGQFKQAICADDKDLIYVTLSGLVECREQMNGRVRWRTNLPDQAWCRSAVLIADGKVYVPRMYSPRYPKSLGAASTLFCLSAETGEIEWRASIGIGDRLRASPVHCQGVVAFGSLYKAGDEPTFVAADRAIGQAIDAFDAATGQHLYRIDLPSTGTLLNGPSGCASDSLFFFTGGGEGSRDRGQTIAFEPRTGKILWRSPHFASQTGTPSYRDGRLYLPGTYRQPLECLSAETGERIWSNRLSEARWHVDVVALGPGYFSVNNKYRGGAWLWDSATGEPLTRAEEPRQIWGPAHGCGAIVLTASGHALSATIGGICLTDIETGETAWISDGFGSFTCPHPIAANGRIFYAPQTSGMLFCFEPVAEDQAVP